MYMYIFVCIYSLIHIYMYVYIYIYIYVLRAYLQSRLDIDYETEVDNLLIQNFMVITIIRIF
jgi:hypothetical protein